MDQCQIPPPSTTTDVKSELARKVEELGAAIEDIRLMEQSNAELVEGFRHDLANEFQGKKVG